MSRNVERMWIVVFAVAVLGFAPIAMAQDMTSGVVTDPPAPVADGYATFTGTYENLGPGPAADYNITYDFPIQMQTWPPESDGFLTLLESTDGTDTNGNDAFWGFESERMCAHWKLVLQMPNDTGDQVMIPNPMPAGGSGTFNWEMPVIPMEGINTGRFEVTEPERLRNTYSLAPDSYISVGGKPWENVLYQFSGLYNVVAMAGTCDDGGEGCLDRDACMGDRLWEIPGFEADLVVVNDGLTDPTYGCAPLENAAEVAGNIAVLRRGGETATGGLCYFYDKMQNAQDAGAAGLIMVNDGRCSDDPNADPDECTILWGGDPGIGYLYSIPTVMISRRQGEELISAIEGGETVRAAMGDIAGDTLDVMSYVYSPEDDTNLTNDFSLTRVPLGEMGPTDFVSFVPAAAYASGAQGAFFQTDLDINNKGDADAVITFGWLPRGADNSDFFMQTTTLPAGQSRQYENVLQDVFGLDADVVGGIVMVADSPDVIGMSRTYNVPGGKVAGTFGQALPAVPADDFITTGERQRIIFMSENDDIRANVGCINGRDGSLRINIELFDAEGTSLEVKTMDLGPLSNNQINRVFRDYSPVNGYVDVWTESADSDFYCYGSVLDNETSDPTTVLPQVPADTMTFVPAAAVASGAQGAFFQTDVDLNNAGTDAVEYQFMWLPRGADNSAPTYSQPFTLGAGMGARYENVLTEVFGLEPNSIGAIGISADTMDLLAMTRTYNIPGAKVAGTFGQALPGVPMSMMIPTGVTKRIIFMNENDDTRANLGCVNGTDSSVRVTVDMYSADGEMLETKFMDLGPYGNNQLNRVFEDYAPVNGYVDVSTTTADAYIYCYGSVLDNETSDPTTVLPQ